MHSCVVQLAQTAGSRTRTSRGETIDCTKLNCPIGQTYLQNAASRNTPSITSAPTRYAIAIHAVSQGLSQSANVSYAHRKIAISPTASHFVRNHRGQLRFPSAGNTRRAIV